MHTKHSREGDWVLMDFVKNNLYIPGCKSTWLIQRLRKREGREGVENKNGFPECSFDYMGSAEFDFGSGNAKALKKMRLDKSMGAYTLNVFGPPEFTWEVENSFHEWEDHRAIKNKHLLDATLFVIAPKMLRPHVDEILHLIAFGEEHLKQRSLLRDTLFCSPDWKTDPYEEICGWLEMDNGFMFFSDPQMWMDFCAYFKVQIPKTFTFIHADFSKVNEDLELAPRKSA